MKYHGFTLVELLIVLVLIGILLLSGIPALRHFVLDNRIAAETNRIISGLQFARSEAVKRGSKVWFTKNEVVSKDNGAVLRVFQALPDGDQLSFNGGFGQDDYLEFNALGGVSNAGSFIYCTAIDEGRKIIINSSGRIRVEKIRC